MEWIDGMEYRERGEREREEGGEGEEGVRGREGERGERGKGRDHKKLLQRFKTCSYHIYEDSEFWNANLPMASFHVSCFGMGTRWRRGEVFLILRGRIRWHCCKTKH